MPADQLEFVNVGKGFWKDEGADSAGLEPIDGALEEERGDVRLCPWRKDATVGMALDERSVDPVLLRNFEVRWIADNDVEGLWLQDALRVPFLLSSTRVS